MNTEHICIRELRPDDSVAAITELLHTAYAPLAAMGFKYLATHQDEAMTRRRLQSGISIVAELDGAIVGTVTLRAPNAESRCAWYLQPGVWSFGQFAVRPDLQRNGLGEKLMHAIEQRALQHRAAELALDTAEGATHLVRWYERLGFRFIQHVSWEETNYRSVVMSKRLAAHITHATTPDDIAAIRSLFKEYAAWLQIDLSYQGFAEELATLPGCYAAPRGCLLLVTVNDQPAGCVALRPIGEKTCEMKRLFVRESFHGRGLGRALAQRVIAEARDAGYATMVLDTLPFMQNAIRLYEALEFKRRAAYYDSPLQETVFMELRLGGI